MEGQEITGALSTEGLNLQQAVFSQSGISGDVSLELNPHVSLADVKGLQLSSASDASSQVQQFVFDIELCLGTFGTKLFKSTNGHTFFPLLLILLQKLMPYSTKVNCIGEW